MTRALVSDYFREKSVYRGKAGEVNNCLGFLRIKLILF